MKKLLLLLLLLLPVTGCKFMSDVQICFSVSLKEDLVIDIAYNNSDSIYIKIPARDDPPDTTTTTVFYENIPYSKFDEKIFLQSIKNNNYSSFCNFTIKQNDEYTWSLSFIALQP